MGATVGEVVGTTVGKTVGTFVGVIVGILVGTDDGGCVSSSLIVVRLVHDRNASGPTTDT